jgi:hypothetical protein
LIPRISIRAITGTSRQPRLEPLPQPIGDVGILGGVARRRLQIDLMEAALRLAGADHVLERDAAVREVRRRQFVHAVAVQPGVEVEAHHDRIVVRRDRDAVQPEHDHVELEIVPDLEHRCVLTEDLEPGERRVAFDLRRRLAEQVAAAMAERDVARLVGAEREGDADQIGAGRIGAGRLGIDRHPALMLRLHDPAVERLDVDHGFIGVVLARRIGLIGHGGGRGDGIVGDLAQFGEQGAEAVMFEEGAQRRVGDALEFEILERFGQRDVAAQRNQLAA